MPTPEQYINPFLNPQPAPWQQMLSDMLTKQPTNLPQTLNYQPPAPPVPKRVVVKSTWPTNYNDPVYDLAEQAASQATGVPAVLIRSIRMKGEKSNNGQVSSAGAQTPYQFVPSTRQGMIKNYHVDPYADPTSGAMAAALHLKESYHRTGSWSAAVAGYNGGIAAEKNVSAGGAGLLGQNQSYIQRVEAGLGNASQLPTGYDPSLFAPAIASINEAQAAANQPFQITTPRQPMPDAPTVPELPTKDFTASDKMLASMAPTAFSPQEQHALQRRRLWQGAAQALASLPEDAGVGSILAKVGAGMLGGRLSANDEIQQRADEFDREMQQYHMLQFKNEGDKADEAYNRAMKQTELAYTSAINQYQAKLADWTKNGGSTSVEGNMFLSHSLGKDGSIVTDVVPIPALTNPQFAIHRATIQAQAAQGQNEAMRGNQTLVNSAVVSAAVQPAANDVFSASADANTPDGTKLATAAFNFGTTASEMGLWKEIATASGSDPVDLEKQAEAAAGIKNGGLGQQITKEQMQLKQNFIATKMAQLFMQPDGAKLLTQYAPLLSGAAISREREVTKTRRGNTTTTTTEAQ